MILFLMVIVMARADPDVLFGSQEDNVREMAGSVHLFSSKENHTYILSSYGVDCYQKLEYNGPIELVEVSFLYITTQYLPTYLYISFV